MHSKFVLAIPNAAPYASLLSIDLMFLIYSSQVTAQCNKTDEHRGYKALECVC
jgi:hypothetical protein